MGNDQHADQRALYIISVAAELAGVHPQTLRIYERKGLIEPSRTEGRSRRYSDRDIALLQRIQELTNEGVSLAGVRKILELAAEAERLQQRIAALDAPVTVKVPPGTQTGKTVRVKGRGIPRTSGDPGALLVTFDVVVPKELDDDAKAAIETLAAALPGNPREHLGV